VDLTDRATYRHWSQDKVRWGDQDGSRHINNVAYAGYLENARAEMMIERVMPHREKGHGFVVRRVTIEYLGVGNYPGRVDVGTAVTDVGESSFTVVQAVFVGDECLATGETVQVQIHEGRRAPISEALRAVLDAERPG
jgi:acyl-CoA thioester hydrolase